MKFALIPCAATEWQDEGRLLGRVELPPTPAGENACLMWIDQLRPVGLRQIYHGPDELARRTAELIGRKLQVPTRAVHSLAEVDVGLWAGLKESDLESRYASAHRELREAPLHVSAPGGETIAGAQARLRAFLRKQARRDQDAPVALVLRPVSFALAWLCLTRGDCSTLWELAWRPHEPVIVDTVPGRSATGEAEV